MTRFLLCTGYRQESSNHIPERIGLQHKVRVSEIYKKGNVQSVGLTELVDCVKSKLRELTVGEHE